MRHPSLSRAPAVRRWRGCAGLAGAVAGLAVLAAVVLVFGGASDTEWLAPTPEDVETPRRLVAVDPQV